MAYNSAASDLQKAAAVREVASAEPGLQLLYTTPESLLKPALRDALLEAHASGTLCAFAIDEAHCISEWGHDFRPAYLQLSTLKDDFPGVPIAAVTASATPRVQASIVDALRLARPAVITASFNRPNIRLGVRHKALLGARGGDDDVLQDLLAFIAARPGQCGIVYARLRATCDWLVSALSGCDLDVAKYHAGMDQDQRRKVLRDWSDGSVDIVVATIAFGMGIDRADVRWVVHWNMPSSVEGYYQEAGRAGRDGQPSESVVRSRDQPGWGLGCPRAQHVSHR
ncbi:MAG: putative ATP-dependent DNA helicase recQ [Monoraphidium minutum]|nr:MAG: putative ATP-dependent DNA helicase recQ [Monoraphidium minutum]